jgi:hypothetical protein
MRTPVEISAKILLAEDYHDLRRFLVHALQNALGESALEDGAHAIGRDEVTALECRVTRGERSGPWKQPRDLLSHVTAIGIDEARRHDAEEGLGLFVERPLVSGQEIDARGDCAQLPDPVLLVIGVHTWNGGPVEAVRHIERPPPDLVERGKRRPGGHIRWRVREVERIWITRTECHDKAYVLANVVVERLKAVGRRFPAGAGSGRQTDERDEEPARERRQ